MIEHIWEGIYQDFNGIKAVGEGFNSIDWVNHSKTKVLNYLASMNQENLIPPLSIRPTSLPLVCAISGLISTGNLRIIDFGGGLGFSYLSFIESCTQADLFEYHIIESPNICQMGREIFNDHKNLFFHPNLHDLHITTADIVYMNSVLQYIEDWKSLIARILRFKPKLLLLDDLPAGDIPTFATIQNYYESQIPYWFFNANEIVDHINSFNYTLVYKSKFLSTVLGKLQRKPMNNFPNQYQLDFGCTLHFSRSSI